MRFADGQWAVILGGSSGFGLATAQKLAEHGMHCFLVHRDRRGAMARIEPEFDRIRQTGVSLVTLNVDALDPTVRADALGRLAEAMGPAGRVRVFLHSIAFGNLKPLLPGTERVAVLEDEDFARTIHAMGTSLVAWSRDLLERRLFADDARVFGLTSEGNTLAWRGYAAVAAAKVALESVSRAMAVEFAPFGVRTNVIQAGVTDTPALRAIPGHERLAAQARERNPFGRLTTPRDVADVIYLLSTDEAAWVNGALIRVDGGEHVSGASA